MNKTYALLLGSLIITTVIAGQSPAATLSLVPSLDMIKPGETIMVDVNIAALNNGGPPSLGAYGISITFNEIVLAFDGMTFESFLGLPDPDFSAGIDPPFETDIFVSNSSPSIVLIDQISLLSTAELDSLQPKSFTLATLSFKGISLGESSMQFEFVDLSDAFGNTIQDPSLMDTNISVVPIPGTFLLSGSAILGLISFRRWNRKKR